MRSNRLAPEWARQDAIIIVWPHSYSDWACELKAIEKVYIELSKAICKDQHLIIIAYNKEHQLNIKRQLSSYSINPNHISFVNIATNDTWVRDYGPICVNTDRGVKILDFKFDAWGQKYKSNLDNAFTESFIEQYKISAHRQTIDQVLEGGNLEINDKSELLCSSLCFKDRSYTQSIDLSELENQFTNWFGCCNTHWINDVQLIGDDTDGHIDTLARFCANDIIAYTSINKLDIANNDALQRLATQLKSIQKQSSNGVELVPLPLPKPIFSSKKQLPACYTNFLITNKSILVPIFKDEQDDIALKLLDEIFSSREIVGIECGALIQQFGGIHCATMQIPEGILK